MRIFSYTSSINTWDVLDSPIVGAALDDMFRWSVSLSLDRIIVAIRAKYNSDNGSSRSYESILLYFKYKSIRCIRLLYSRSRSR